MPNSDLISAADLSRRLGDASVVLLDCRFDLMRPLAGREAWLESHIPGAVYADLDRDLSGPITPDTGRHPLPEPDVLAERFRGLGVGRNSTVIAYDASSGAIAARAWWLLRWLGHDNVMILDGGFNAWLDAGLPLASGATESSRGDLQARSRPDWILTTEEVVRMGADETRKRLVDARDAVRFRGEREPIDRVAGRIPGTSNLPFAATIGDDGRLQDAVTLRRLLEDCLGGDLDTEWGVMCGSGVTACHLALVAQIAGLGMPRVYVGSYSEWIRDAGRPIATGPEDSADDCEQR
ncbi:MAG: sulfurtransferase [Woeseiaceae bacterium]|nr:sulfurtransferase [Woeseiaceae bacterium]